VNDAAMGRVGSEYYAATAVHKLFFMPKAGINVLDIKVTNAGTASQVNTVDVTGRLEADVIDVAGPLGCHDLICRTITTQNFPIHAGAVNGTSLKITNGVITLVDGSGNQSTGAAGDVLTSNGTSPPTWQAVSSGASGPFTETSGNDWENTGTSANQIILKHTSNQFRGINFVDNSNNGDAGLRWWKNSIGSSNTNLTQGGTQKAEIFMGDASANWQFHNWHGDGNNHGNTDFYGGGDGDISGANSHRPILRISPSHPTTDTDTSRQGTQRYTDVAYWSTNKWGKVMIGVKDNHTNITRPTFALDVRGECNIGDTAGGTQNSDGGTCSYRIGSKIVVPALGSAGQVLTVNSGGTAAEWATAASGGGGSTAIYARQHWPGTHILGTSSTWHEWSNITSSDYSVIDFQSTPAIVYSNATASGGQARNGMFKVPTGHAGVYNIRLSGCFNIPHRTVNFEIRKNTSTVICDANHALSASGLDDGDHTSLYQLYTLADLAEGDEISARVSASPATGNSWSGGVRMLGDTKRNFFEIFKVS
jgi:hypothetical protein